MGNYNSREEQEREERMRIEKYNENRRKLAENIAEISENYSKEIKKTNSNLDAYINALNDNTEIRQECIKYKEEIISLQNDIEILQNEVLKLKESNEYYNKTIANLEEQIEYLLSIQ